MRAKADLTQAVSDLVEGLGEPFASSDVVRALPEFKPAAVRGYLHWLVASGRLVAHREAGVPYLIYCSPREMEAQGEHFVCTLALIEAMRRMGAHHCDPRPVPDRSGADLAWVRSVIERCKTRQTVDKLIVKRV